MRLFTISFVTRSYGRGVAVVTARDADEAYTVLVSYGQLNHTPEEYGEILDIKDSGCTNNNYPAVLEEELTGIRIIKGEPGDSGVGIKSIDKSGTSGLDDLYTITFTDNTTYTYSVRNSANIEDVVYSNTVNKIVALTSVEYEDLKSKDGNTLYIIKEEGND